MDFKTIYDIAVPLKKREEEKYNTWVAWVVRPLSVLFTMPFINSKMKPITITMISIICAVIGFVILVLAETTAVRVVGWIGYFMWAILDGVDGNLARCKKQCSLLGDLWDTMGGYIAMVLIYFSAGIVAFFDSNIWGNNYLPAYVYIILGGVSAIFSIFPRLILHKKKSSCANAKAVVEYTDTTNYGFVKKFVGSITSPSGIIQILFLISILFHLFNLFTIVYMIINLLIMMISLKGLLSE